MSFTLLGTTEHDAVVAESSKAPFGAELLKKLFLGGGMSAGAAIAWGVFEMLRDNPRDAFSLLRAWGPWAIVTMFAMYAVYDLSKKALSIGKRGVIAVEALSTAVKQIAEKDDRQIQELQTLTSYTSQGVERQAASQRELHEKVDGVESKIDKLYELVLASKEKTT